MPTNDFLAFASASGANVSDQTDWLNDPVVPEGFTAGILPSAQTNKALRQGTLVAAGTAQFILNTLGVDVLDDGDLGHFAALLQEAVVTAGGGGGGVGTGGIPEAPLDGQYYGRGAHVWTPVLPLTGGTLTGPLNLNADPTLALGATTKQYVDRTTVALSGDTMTGPLTLNADPTFALHAATKQYVDSHVGTAGYLPLAGGTMTGPIVHNLAVGLPSSGALSGARVSLYPGGGVTPDMAIGVNTGLLWHGVRSAADNFGWFAGTTQMAMLEGGGRGLHLYGNAAGAAAEHNPVFGININVADGNNPAVGLISYGAGQPIVYGQAAGGTGAAPAALASGNHILSLRGGGYDGTGWFNNSAAIIFQAANSWLATDHSTSIQFMTTPAGSLTSALRATVEMDGTFYVGASSSSVTKNTGPGTVNVDTGYFINNTSIFASPAFTGTPTAPTPALADSSTTIATTAFVQNHVGAGLPLTGGHITGALTVDGTFIQGNGSPAYPASFYGPQVNIMTGSNLNLQSGSTLTLANGATATCHGTVAVASDAVLNISAPTTIFAAAATFTIGNTVLPIWGGTPTAANHLVNKGYTDGAYMPFTGGIFTGNVTCDAYLTLPSGANLWCQAGSQATLAGNVTVSGPTLAITSACTPTWTGTPVGGNQLTPKGYVDAGDAANLPLAGGHVTGALTVDGAFVQGHGATAYPASFYGPQVNIMTGTNLNLQSGSTLTLANGATATYHGTMTVATDATLGISAPTTIFAAAGTFTIGNTVLPIWGGTPTASNHLVNKAYTDAAYMPFTGGTFTGNVYCDNYLTLPSGATLLCQAGSQTTLSGAVTVNGPNLTIGAACDPTWAGTPSGPNDLLNKTYGDNTYFAQTGGTLAGQMAINYNAAATSAQAIGAQLRIMGADEGVSRVVNDVYGTTSTAIGGFYMRRARRTMANPSPVQSGDELGRIHWLGYYATTWQNIDGAVTAIRAFAGENWSSSSNQSYLQFDTIDTGHLGALPRVTIDVNLTLTGAGYQPGGGSWIATSDARTKKHVEQYECGLDEIRQLQPIRWQYNGTAGIEDTGRVYHGLAAEEAQHVMPEMVHSLRMKLRTEDPEPTDVLMLNATPLTFAMINAIKQLAARLERVENFVVL